MNKIQYIKYKRRKQKRLKIKLIKEIFDHLQIVITVSFVVITASAISHLNQNIRTVTYTNEAYESNDNHLASNMNTEISKDSTNLLYYPEFKYSREWNKEETYLLARLCTAEAQGCGIKTKALVVMTVMNRVESNLFPDTIYKVIFQKNQFQSISSGNWDEIEPDIDSYTAIELVKKAKYDYSVGSLYFGANNDKDWNSENLTFLYESENLKFYK